MGIDLLLTFGTQLSSELKITLAIIAIRIQFAALRNSSADGAPHHFLQLTSQEVRCLSGHLRPLIQPNNNLENPVFLVSFDVA